MNTSMLPATPSQPRTSRQHGPRIAACLLGLALGACTALPRTEGVTEADLAWVLAGADTLPASAPVEDRAELLAVTDEMRAFARAAVARESGVPGKAAALALAIGSKDGLRLRYDVDATLSAAQAFAQHRANCLSYTLLYVVLAREVGVPAEFNEVDIPPVWDAGNDETLLLYRHINARIPLPGSRYQIVDVSSEEYDPNYPQRIVGDAVAEAQFYNNRAAELRLAQRYREALAEQLAALALAPQVGYLWTNLGSLYLANGNTRAARIAVTRALALDPDGVLNYGAAANIYAALGEPALASQFRVKAQQALERNPYYHYQLAVGAMKGGDESRAYDETRRAIELHDRDPRFFVLLAALLERLGRPAQAQDAMHTALALTPDAALQARYRSKFARLGTRG